MSTPTHTDPRYCVIQLYDIRGRSLEEVAREASAIDSRQCGPGSVVFKRSESIGGHIILTEVPREEWRKAVKQ